MCVSRENLSDEEKAAWLTKSWRDFLGKASTWNWTSILHKSNILGVLFVVLLAFSKVVILFLSFLIEALDALAFPQVLVIFYAIGISLFLLPPVPGVPVYLFGGVILTAKLQGDYHFFSSGETGFWCAVVLISCICLTLKLLAVFMEQKLIGEQLSRSVAVRKAVGVNSVAIRAIGKVLREPGLSKGKMAILVGGPDWPTSVLTGILRLNPVEMLIGTMPVLALIMPCVMAGAFQLRVGSEDDTGIWGTISAMTLLFAAGTQSISLMAAVFYTDAAVAEYGDELRDPALDDQEVLAATKKSEVRVAKMKAVTHWSNVPRSLKALIFLSVGLHSAACHTLQWFGASCFLEYQLTDSYKNVIGNNPMKFFEPLGQMCMLLFILSMVTWKMFGVLTRRLPLPHKIYPQDSNGALILGKPSEDPAPPSKD
jgi:hypothetical protein